MIERSEKEIAGARLEPMAIGADGLTQRFEPTHHQLTSHLVPPAGHGLSAAVRPD